MNPLETLKEVCPYCGEAFQTLVDFSAGEQEYFEDCPVCCRPILFRITFDSDLTFGITIHREDE